MEGSQDIFKNERLQSKLSIEDFTIIKVIGRGSYGKVLLVKKKGEEEICDEDT